MLKIYQTTINKTVNFEGIGLHSGKKSKIRILPGEASKGVIFKRIDLNENNFVQAKYDKVTSAKLCTTLENSFGVKVSTVEHLLAALYISDIDNVVIEIDNEEVPIMDGSAKQFLDVFKTVKLKKLNKKRSYLKILEKVDLVDDKRQISIEPFNVFQVDFQLDYYNSIIGKQKNSINFETDNLEEVSQSRTFCLFEDIEKIKKIGLAKGGSLENALVVDQNKILNDGGLRNEKEFVNHKILDLAGDFVLSGHRILGKVICSQGGHQLSNMFLRKLFTNKTSYTTLELEEVVISKNINNNLQEKLAVNA
jgi:UDP-3-O-[3-hydroxymyristoyl] N-acetylglucosamine deacetylase